MDYATQVWALVGVIVFTLTVPVFTHLYKWVPVNLMLGVKLWWTSIPSMGEEVTKSIPSFTYSIEGHGK